MSEGCAEPHSSDGNRRIPCPLHGCKRVYTDTSVLESHIKDHQIPAQSAQGKLLVCSSVGCSLSFPNMQKLMEHMRQHHKLNIFFQCESCRTKLRSYRGLLTHLHSCSKVTRGKPKSAEQTITIAGNPSAVGQTPPQMEMDSMPEQLGSQVPQPNGSITAGPPPKSAAPSLSLEKPPQQHPEAALLPPAMTEASTLPLSQEAAPAVPEGPAHTQTRFPEPILSVPAFPGSSVFWRKNQGTSNTRCVLWEHTRGHYTCLQCGHMVTNRKEMTQHISSVHGSYKAAEDAGNSSANA